MEQGAEQGENEAEMRGKGEKETVGNIRLNGRRSQLRPLKILNIQ